MHSIYDVLIRPLASSKSVVLEKVASSYTFRVASSSSKPQIKAAVEKFYGVKVRRVNTLIMPGKRKRRGSAYAKTPSWKKAYVTLIAPHKIEFMARQLEATN